MNDNFHGSEEELLRHCSGFLAEYKRPARIHLVQSLPKNATGKIDRARLQVLADST